MTTQRFCSTNSAVRDLEGVYCETSTVGSFWNAKNNENLIFPWASCYLYHKGTVLLEYNVWGGSAGPREICVLRRWSLTPDGNPPPLPLVKRLLLHRRW